MIIKWITSIFSRKIVKNEEWDNIIIQLESIKRDVEEINALLDRQTDIIGIVAGVQSEMMIGLSDQYFTSESDDSDSKKIVIPLPLPTDDDFMN